MQPGFYRVHLSTPENENWITLYVPVDERGYLDRAAGPAILKSEWSGNWYLGEFVLGDDGAEWNRIRWNASVSDSLTDLLRAPLGVGALVRVHMGDGTDTQYYDFEVRELAKLK